MDYLWWLVAHLESFKLMGVDLHYAMYYELGFGGGMPDLSGVSEMPDLSGAGAMVDLSGVDGLPELRGVKVETQLCLVSEMQKQGVPVKDILQAVKTVGPYVGKLEGWSGELVQRCPSLSHPWAEYQIGANLSTRLYNTADLPSEAFLGAVYNHSMCCFSDGLTLNPLPLKTGGYLLIDYQGLPQRASCDKWNIGSEAITDMLESPAILQFYSEKKEEIRALCDTYCVFVDSKRGR